ncbi:MAG: histidinol-phosphatase HisJ family protein [Phycisphaerae bacterium]|nr:histidinol-phosphatase HisJ family protein [Phycisphaerae bacterium]
MKIRTDFHLHTQLSVDAETTVEAMVQRAIELGFDEIALTDHLDNDPADPGAGKYDPHEALAQSHAMAARFADRIVVRHGVELAEAHRYVRENQAVYELAADVLIGSIHYVEGHGVHETLFDVMAPREAIDRYFVLAAEMAEQGDFDVLGHLDYFLRYTRKRHQPDYDPQAFRPRIEAILRTIIDRNIALEVNTSGYRRGAGIDQPFPQPVILGWYRAMGGRLLSIGSDAHKPDDMAIGFEPVAKILAAIGFDEYHVYRDRQPVAIGLRRD